MIGVGVKQFFGQIGHHQTHPNTASSRFMIVACRRRPASQKHSWRMKEALFPFKDVDQTKNPRGMNVIAISIEVYNSIHIYINIYIHMYMYIHISRNQLSAWIGHCFTNLQLYIPRTQNRNKPGPYVLASPNEKKTTKKTSGSFLRSPSNTLRRFALKTPNKNI